MKYYKYTDENGNIFQYEATERIINSSIVTEITEEEYNTTIAEIMIETAEE